MLLRLFMQRIALLLVSALTSITLAAHAQAAEPEPSAEPQADRNAAASTARAGDFEHDGLYLRFGLGFGGFSEGLSSEDKNAADEPSQGRIGGVSSVGEFMIGSAISRRLVLGGGFWTSTILVSDFTQTSGNDVPNDLQEPGNFTIVGAFGDYYFGQMPRRRVIGAFHAQAGLGLGVLNGIRPEQVREEDPRVAIGPGVMFGFGYEWWIHEQWGLGVLARLTAGGLVEKDDRGDFWYHGAATFPSFLFTATYN